MSQQSTLAELGINLNARALRERLAETVRDADTIRRLLKIAERAENRGVPASRRQEATRVS